MSKLQCLILNATSLKNGGLNDTVIEHILNHRTYRLLDDKLQKTGTLEIGRGREITPVEEARVESFLKFMATDKYAETKLSEYLREHKTTLAEPNDAPIILAGTGAAAGAGAGAGVSTDAVAGVSTDAATGAGAGTDSVAGAGSSWSLRGLFNSCVDMLVTYVKKLNPAFIANREEFAANFVAVAASHAVRSAALDTGVGAGAGAGNASSVTTATAGSHVARLVASRAESPKGKSPEL